MMTRTTTSLTINNENIKVVDTFYLLRLIIYSKEQAVKKYTTD